MEVLQKVNGTHPNDLVRETFCTLRESAWDYLILDRACHLWSHRWCRSAKEVEDPWKHELTSGWVADSGNGCKEGHWLGRYNINAATVLSVDVGLTTSTVQFFPVEASMAKEEEDLLQKVNGTKFNDELAEILCDHRRSNPWNIETLDKACYLWSQTRLTLTLGRNSRIYRLQQVKLRFLELVLNGSVLAPLESLELQPPWQVLGPLRDFLKRNLEKYAKYQDAIEQGAEIREATDGDDFRSSKEKEEQMEVNRNNKDEARPRRRLLRKADRANTVYNVKIKMPVDLDLEEEEEEAAPENEEAKESPPDGADQGSGPAQKQTLAERVEQDWKKPQLVEATEAFAVRSKFSAFGGLRRGEKFTMDKAVVLRTEVASLRDGVEDFYRWSGPTWLQQSWFKRLPCAELLTSAAVRAMASWFQRTKETLFSVNGITISCLAIGGWLLVRDLLQDYWAAKRLAQRKALENQMHLPPREWHPDDLAVYNGTDPQKPILIGVDGEVFNVWRGRDFYGAEGPYGVFAGKDATRYFAKQIVSLDEDDGQPLTSEEMDNMKNWKEFLRYKYDAAGTLVS
eukprot:symbB.v1.2.016969.t1/scaffold1272.1/size127520/1